MALCVAILKWNRLLTKLKQPQPRLIVYPQKSFGMHWLGTAEVLGHWSWSFQGNMEACSSSTALKYVPTQAFSVSHHLPSFWVRIGKSKVWRFWGLSDSSFIQQLWECLLFWCSSSGSGEKGEKLKNRKKTRVTRRQWEIRKVLQIFYSSISFAIHSAAQVWWEGYHRSLSFIPFIATDNILPGLVECFKLISYIVDLQLCFQTVL